MACALVLKTNTMKPPHIALVHTLVISAGKTKRVARANKHMPLVSAKELDAHVIGSANRFVSSDHKSHACKHLTHSFNKQTKASAHKPRLALLILSVKLASMDARLALSKISLLHA